MAPGVVGTTQHCWGETPGLVFHRFRLRAILQPDDLRRGMNYLARGVASTQRSVSHAKKNKATYASDASGIPERAKLSPRAGCAGCWQQLHSHCGKRSAGF